MIKKNVALTILGGDRNKQQVLKEFIRPAPSSTISSTPPSVRGGYGGGDIPGCGAAGPTGRNPCAEYSDSFSGPLAAGGWDSSATGTRWIHYPLRTHEQACWGPVNGAPYNFVERYPSNEFCFQSGFSGPGYIDSGQDGPALDYWYTAGVLNTPLWSYRASPDSGQGGPITFSGGSWYTSGAALVGMTVDELPVEYLVRLNFTKIVDERPSGDENMAGGVTFDFGSVVNESTWISSPSFTQHLQVQIVIKPKLVVGQKSDDYLVVSHLSGTNPNSISVGYPYNTFKSMEGCGGTNFQEGANYNLRVRIESGGVKAKIWLASESEPQDYPVAASGSGQTDYTKIGFAARLFGVMADCSAPSIGSPCLDFPDQRQQISFSMIRINPSATVGADDPCDSDTPTGAGYYLDTLLKRSNYWVPASDNVSYYRQVYFDGLAVEEGTHYWLDGLRIHPNDPAIFDGTIATASLVIQ